MAHAKEVGEDEDKADDYNPLEATALLSMDAARVEVVGEDSPRGDRHPYLGVGSLQVRTGCAKHPDNTHSQAQCENRESDPGKAKGRSCRGV